MSNESSSGICAKLTEPSIIQTCTENHFSLVQVAVHQNDMNLLKELHATGASLDAQNRYGWTALHMAVLSSNLGMVNELLDCGANHNIQDIHGRTPLYMAVYMGNKHLSELLLVHRADPCIKTYDGETLFHAREKCNKLLSVDRQIELIDLIPINEALAKQKNDLDCFGHHPEFFRIKQNTINVRQRFVIDKIEMYFDCIKLDKSSISRNGYCNGFAFLSNYYDSCGKRLEHEKILKNSFDGMVL
jgi:ankyrin repeat protein